MGSNDAFSVDYPSKLDEWIRCPNCDSIRAGFHQEPDGEVLVRCPDCSYFRIVSLARGESE